ncbi:hypothetical protein [Kiloniella antarctica]|uniref:PAS fold-4 domain-containing protein n=1 Tax=Kiloniella antarctica TaxID=1550907 RepID=A0ABW5BMA3_9PROT
MTIPLIQSRPFVSYWPHLVLNRWHQDKNDFIYSFWGTKLTTVYDMDLTGKYILRGEFKQTEDTFWQAHMDVMTNLKPLYIHTNIHWLDKDFQFLNAVIIPLEREGKVSETLAYVTFK